MSPSETSEDDTSEVIFVVLGDGLQVHGAYRCGDDADLHARCVGAWVAKVQLMDRVPQSVIDRRRQTAEIVIDLNDLGEE